VCQLIIQEHPRYGLANFNLGYIAMQENNLPLAKYYFEKSLQIDPDHVQTLVNLAVVYYQTNQKKYIKPLLYRALKIEPANEKIKAMIADLK
jgi:Tfp pilus assembly protein PilF